MTGVIKRKLMDKGFGFLATPDGTEYFFHHTGVPNRAFDSLREGQQVTFDEETVPSKQGKGPRAVNVVPAPGNR